MTAVAVLAVLAAGWFVLVSPKRSQAADLRAQAVAQSQANDTLRAQVAALTLQARQLPQQRQRLALLAQKIPDSTAMPALILRLREAADRAGVTLVSIQPAPPTAVTLSATGALAPTTGAATGAVPAPTGAAGGRARQLLTIPVTIQVTGGFFQLEQFMTNLEDLPRSFLVGQLSIAAASSTGTTSAGSTSAGLSGGSLSMTITGQVFLTAAKPAATAPVSPSPAPG